MSPLYIDEHLIALDKPAGLLAVPGRVEADCLATRAQRHWPDAKVVHRLDMATSGLWLMARGLAAQRALSRAFEQRQVHKVYVALVHGDVAGDAGEITWPLAADWPNRPRQKVDLQLGKPALTRWHVLARQGHTTRLALSPVTGRSHQLRVHLLALGHPIVGDGLYGPGAAGLYEPGAASLARGDAALPSRLHLHAEALDLPHPAEPRRLALHCAAPF